MPNQQKATMQSPPKSIPVIETTAELASFCTTVASDTYITVDTEFLRETTYYPKLCLIQIAGANATGLIDPLAAGIDLAPFYELMANSSVLKVFHAARQDVEILVKATGSVPHPIFDTQVAAMVCGFGDQVGYESIARKLANASIDKSAQFTDWSRRPLSHKQLAYALSDVTYLRVVYEKLKAMIDKSRRDSWLADEIDVLSDPATYAVDPEQTWRRIKARIQNKKQQAVLMSVAAWREREAQARDVPRGRIVKDEAIAEIAIQLPQNREGLSHLRLLPRGLGDGVIGRGILEAVEQGLKRDPATVPAPKGRGEDMPESAEATAELLKLALRIVSERDGIAPKLLANASDIDAIAMNDNADVPALHGWRRDVFGSLALDIKHGKALLGMKDGKAAIISA